MDDLRTRKTTKSESDTPVQTTTEIVDKEVNIESSTAEIGQLRAQLETQKIQLEVRLGWSDQPLLRLSCLTRTAS